MTTSEIASQPRRRAADDRREQLLAVALELFAAHGWAQTTMKDLAGAAGVATGLVYHYFASKEALLLAVVERYSFLPELRALVAVSSEQPARRVLLEVVRRFDALLSQRAALMRLLLHESAVAPEVAETRRRVMGTGLGLLTQYLEARVAAGELRPHRCEVTARALMAPVLLAHLGGVSATEWLPDLVGQVLDGIAVGDSGA